MAIKNNMGYNVDELVAHYNRNRKGENYDFKD